MFVDLPVIRFVKILRHLILSSASVAAGPHMRGLMMVAYWWLSAKLQ